MTIIAPTVTSCQELPKGPFMKRLRSFAVVAGLAGLLLAASLYADASASRAGLPADAACEVIASNIQAKQAIAVIYNEGPSGPVLLAAVVQPAAP